MRVRQEVSVNAPVEQAFAYLNNPENSLALVPSLVEVKEIASLENGGHRLRFVALGRGGKRCEWESEQTERVPNRLVVIHARTAGMRTIATRRFEQTPTGTRLEAEVEYRVELPWPQKVLTPVVEFQLRRQMRNQLGSLLSVIQGRIEAGSTKDS